MISNVSRHFDTDDEFSIHVPHVRCAHGECPCDREKLCDIWMEYQISRISLAEYDELLHGNWLEITRLRNYTDYLHKLLISNGIIHEEEFGALASMTEAPGPDKPPKGSETC